MPRISKNHVKFSLFIEPLVLNKNEAKNKNSSLRLPKVSKIVAMTVEEEVTWREKKEEEGEKKGIGQ